MTSAQAGQRFVFMVLLAAGCGASVTETVIEVDTDFSWPDEIDVVRVEVIRDGAVEHTRTYSLLIDGARLPARFPVVHRGGTSTDIRVDVVGMLGTRAVGRQSAVFDFVDGQSRVLHVFLDRTCQDLVCAPPFNACRAGACVDPRARPDAGAPDMGVPDTSTPDADSCERCECSRECAGERCRCADGCVCDYRCSERGCDDLHCEAGSACTVSGEPDASFDIECIGEGAVCMFEVSPREEEPQLIKCKEGAFCEVECPEDTVCAIRCESGATCLCRGEGCQFERCHAEERDCGSREVCSEEEECPR